MTKAVRFLSIALIAVIMLSCSNPAWRIDNVKNIPVGAGDSIFFISKKDKYHFSANCNDISLMRDGTILLHKDNLFGYADDDGEVILPDVYKYATVFNNNLAWVVRKNDSPGAINQKGELKFTLREVDWVEVYYDDMARYYVTEKKVKRYGFANKEGEKVVPPIYYDATPFNEGLAAVKGVNGKWGYIDVNGAVILLDVYDNAKMFVNGFAPVSKEEKWGVIDVSGNFVVEPQFDDVVSDGENFIVSREEKWGWCNIESEILIEPVYERVMPFNGADLAPVLINGKWAYINKKGDIAIKRQFDEAYPFVDDIALVKIGDYYGFINEDGKYVINPQYTYISPDYINNAIFGVSFFSSVQSDR